MLVIRNMKYEIGRVSDEGRGSEREGEGQATYPTQYLIWSLMMTSYSDTPRPARRLRKFIRKER